MSTALILCYLNLKILRMAEQWDFTTEDTRVGTKRLKQSSMLTSTQQESQLPDDLANCFNVTIQTTRYGHTTAILCKLKIIETYIDYVCTYAPAIGNCTIETAG